MLLGGPRCGDFNPSLTIRRDAWARPKGVFRRSSPDQYVQLRAICGRLPWGATSNARTAESRSVPTHEVLGRMTVRTLGLMEPAIQLDKKPAIIVVSRDATMQLTPQENQLMSKHRIPHLKPQLRLELARPGRPERKQSSPIIPSA